MRLRTLPVAALLLVSSVRVAGAQCAFQHPASAKILKGSLVQMFTICTIQENFGAEPNTTTEGGIQSCYPTTTGNERAGSPPLGWLWGPKGTGQVTLKAGAGDVAITLDLHDVRANTGLAENAGRLAMLLRMTIADPAGPMTLIDYPLQTLLSPVHGNVKLKTTLLTMLQGSNPAFASLPPCSNIELLTLLVRDPNGSAFAQLGLYLP